ncbi:MAG TPA: TraR/DksA C4-type zinc finger protein [Capsulimonadaceae bacterium]|jgi:RNA polymerase-binding transcription factor DksA
MKLDTQRKQLELLRAEYEANIAEIRRRDASNTQSDESPVESDIPTHDADAGTVLFERERDQAFAEDYDATLKLIIRALEKVSEGTYGVCDNCKKPIPPARLEALPYAVLGIDCQEQLERF